MAAKTTNKSQHGAHSVVLEVRLDEFDDRAVGEFEVALSRIAQAQELAHFVGRKGRRKAINHENVEHDVPNLIMKALKGVGIFRRKLTDALNRFPDVSFKDQR